MGQEVVGGVVRRRPRETIWSGQPPGGAGRGASEAGRRRIQPRVAEDPHGLGAVF